jgi:Domain of unknown function (DUF3943)
VCTSPPTTSAGRALRALAAVLVTCAAAPAQAEPAEPTKEPPLPYYVDATGEAKVFAIEYGRWFGDDRRVPHPLRAALEMGGLLTVGTTYYWLLPQLNSTDWIIPDLGVKFTDPTVSFDNNMHRTNHLLHPFAGAMSHWFSRVNGLDVYESATYAFLSSLVFETVLEFKETTSINDVIVTPGEGIPAGEFFFHLGDYLNSASGHENMAQRAFAMTLGLPQYVHERWDHVDRAPAGSADELGYTSAYWHRFALGYGRASIEDDRLYASNTVHDLVLDMDLVAMPGFLRPGRFDIGFHQGNFTEVHLRTSLEQGVLADVDLTVKAALAGYYGQDYEGTEDQLSGHAWLLAASMDTRYVDRWILGRRDLFAVAHLLGPTAKLWWALGAGFMAQAAADVHLDFTGMGSPAYQQWIAQNGPAGTKSVLQRHGYYLGVGPSGRVSASLGFRGLELGGRAAYGVYRSIDGLDQEQRDTFNDVSNTDQILELGASVECSPPPTPIGLRFDWRALRHRSQMHPFSADWRDERVGLVAYLRF